MEVVQPQGVPPPPPPPPPPPRTTEQLCSLLRKELKEKEEESQDYYTVPVSLLRSARDPSAPRRHKGPRYYPRQPGSVFHLLHPPPSVHARSIKHWVEKNPATTVTHFCLLERGWVQGGVQIEGVSPPSITMSVAAPVTNAKGEKSKKFQSLNINNLYQVRVESVVLYIIPSSFVSFSRAL